MALKRLMFIRNGETDWNLVGRWQGWVAAPLNDLGRMQAQRLANFIRNIGLNTVYSSDNRRAAETASVLGNALGYAPILDARLRERRVGIWQGLILPEIRAWYPDEYASLTADPDGYVIPDGESIDQVKARASHALNDVIQRAEADSAQVTVAMVSHTTAIRAMLDELVTDVDLSHVNFGNTSVTTVVRDGDGWKLTAAADVSHLEGLMSRYMPEMEDDVP
jgi:broad specificity phosphatase PhoE